MGRCRQTVGESQSNASFISKLHVLEQMYRQLLFYKVHQQKLLQRKCRTIYLDSFEVP